MKIWRLVPFLCIFLILLTPRNHDINFPKLMDFKFAYSISNLHPKVNDVISVDASLSNLTKRYLQVEDGSSPLYIDMIDVNDKTIHAIAGVAHYTSFYPKESVSATRQLKIDHPGTYKLNVYASFTIRDQKSGKHKDYYYCIPDTVFTVK